MATATATEPRESRGTRIEQLERAHAKRVEELESAHAEIEQLRVAEEEAVRKSVREKPTVRAYIMGSEATRLRERREKLEKKIEPLEREITEIAPVLAEERAGIARTELERRLKDAEVIRARELAGWQELGRVMGELAGVWLEDVVVPAEELDQLFAEIQRSGLLTLVDDEELHEKVNAATLPVVRPFPLTLGSVIERLWAVATDAGRLGYRELDPASGGLFLDVERLLPQVTPDLRELPEPELSGRIPKTRANDLR